MRIQNSLVALGLATLLAAALALPVAGQDKPKQPAAQATAPAQQQLAVPQAEKLILLIRLSLLTLNDALQTGNYTVLRDRGGPSFRQANSASGLARVFANLEAQRIDLAPVAVMTPQLSDAQIVGPEQRLLVKGFFPGQPTQINFELIYEPAAGQWQLFGVSVGVVPAQTQAAPGAAASPPPAAKATPPPAKK